MCDVRTAASAAITHIRCICICNSSAHVNWKFKQFELWCACLPSQLMRDWMQWLFYDFIAITLLFAYVRYYFTIKYHTVDWSPLIVLYERFCYFTGIKQLHVANSMAHTISYSVNMNASNVNGAQFWIFLVHFFGAIPQWNFFCSNFFVRTCNIKS